MKIAMVKKIIFVAVLMLISACASTEESPLDKDTMTCPLVFINKNEYATLIFNKVPVQIALTGYNGTCNIVDKRNMSYAVIEPIFEIRRLVNDEIERVPFTYYVSSDYGYPQSYREYKEVAYIPRYSKTARFVGHKIKVPLPEELKYNYGINMGLIIKPSEQIYNNRYFNFHFNGDEEI